MQLTLIKQNSQPHSGYGAGSGTIDTHIYKCPCGNGTVEYIKDNIPGFRESETYIHCEDCKRNYDIKSASFNGIELVAK